MNSLRSVAIRRTGRPSSNEPTAAGPSAEVVAPTKTYPARSRARKVARTIVKSGTRLVREWNGQTHTVLVHADGVEWRAKRYRSLSVVAREITRAHWSGPRFFGLTSKKDALD